MLYQRLAGLEAGGGAVPQNGALVHAAGVLRRDAPAAFSLLLNRR